MAKIISKVNNISKFYNERKILNNVSFTIKEGEIIGLIGENGSGKTTIIKILLGLIPPSEGSILNFGSNKKDEYLKFLGYVSDQLLFYDYFTVEESIRLMQPFYEDHIDIEQLLHYTELTNEKTKRIKYLSLGQKQRLNLALGLINRPKLVLMDEPFNGLDPLMLQVYRDLIFTLRRQYNTSLFISSHNLNELGSICDRVIMLKNGSIVKEVNLSNEGNKAKVFITFKNYEINYIINILKEISDITEIEPIDHNSVEFKVSKNKIPNLNETFIEKGIVISTIEPQKEDLFDLFS